MTPIRAALVLLALAPLPCPADAVILKDGSRYVGDVTREEGGYLVKSAAFPDGIRVKDSEVKCVHPSAERMLDALEADLATALGRYEDAKRSTDPNTWLQSALDLLFEAELRSLDGAEIYPDRKADFERIQGRIRDVRKLCRDAKTLDAPPGETPARKEPEPKPAEPVPAPKAEPAVPALDALAKMSARDVALKAVARLAKEPQVRFRGTLSGSGVKWTGDGIAWPTGASRLLMNGGQPLYRRGSLAIARDRFGAWAPAASASDEARRLASNPSLPELLAAAQRGAARSRFLADQDVAGTPCRVVEIEGTHDELKAHVDSAIADGGTVVISSVKDIPFDKKESWLRLRVFVSGDLAVRRIEREARVRYPQHGSVVIAGAGPCDATLGFDVLEPGETEALPDDVRKKLGVR